MLADSNVSFLLLISAQSHVFAYFFVVFQPLIIACDKRMPIAHTSHSTSAQVKATDDVTCS